MSKMAMPMPHRNRQEHMAAPQLTRQNRQTLFRLFKYVMRHDKWSILTVLLCILVSSFTSLASTLFTGTLIDDYIVPLTREAVPDYAPLMLTLVKLGAVLLAGVVCSYTYNYLMINVSQGTMLRLRKRVFANMEQLPLDFFDTHPHGEIMSVFTNDIDTLRQVISTSLAQLFSSVITIVITFSSMIVLSIPLSFVSVFMAVVMFITTAKLGKYSRGHFRTQQETLARLNAFVEETMSGQKVVKVFSHEQQTLADFESVNEQLRSSADSANKIANILMPINGNLANLGYVLIAVLGAMVALSDHPFIVQHFPLSLGTIVAFLQLNKSFTQPISHISQQINSVLNASVGAERVFNLMDQEPEIDEGTLTLANPQGDVDFRHVNFGYTDEKQILFDIDINTAPGQKIAFVGGTGAGKTTVINLINRFYEVKSGEIHYDGIPITQIKKEALRRSMAVVLQDCRLFTGTVLDNIRYGRLDATDEECMQAARTVGADDFIRRLGNGYHTMIGSDGGNLSQGERQLLTIARAAIANPAVLILDEATSSIDTRTEQLVQKGMDAIMKGRTTFVIAHRLSTVRNADLIVVLEQGRIIEQGSHEQLLKMKGRYHQLYTGNEID